MQGAHVLGLFKEQPDGRFQIGKRLFFSPATRGDVEFKGVGHECAPSLENSGREWNLHTSPGTKITRSALTPHLADP